MQDDATSDDLMKEPLGQLPIEVKVSVGHARPRLGELLQMRGGQVLPLDRRVQDPVDLYVGDRLIARGELQELDGEQSGQLAVHILEIIDRIPAS